MINQVYYAHTLKGESEEKWQTAKKHAENVAELLKKFSIPWCTEEYAENLGLLHDVGKYQSDFQRRLRGEKVSVEHSICGAAQWIEMKWPESGAYCIAGHHSGLPDVGSKTDSADEPTLLGRIKRAAQQDFFAFQNELTLKKINVFPAKDAVCMSGNSKDDIKKEYAFWTRMMFSCLTDADYLDTEAFCSDRKERGVYADLKICRALIDRYMMQFKADTPVKRARDALRRQVMSHVREKADVYLIHMPTGSGKTLTSMQFALERAVLSRKKHIIYVIPYTSIIEQNAKIFKSIFGADAVLEHHCNFDYESVKDAGTRERLQRTSENWDASIIVTTNVQFFESIYGNRSSELRKLHNIANSVIVFDEVHMFPRLFFQPCLEAVRILTQRYHCEAVFMSATMPDFHKWMREFGCGSVKAVDLIADKSDFPIFERCKIENLGQLSPEKLASLAAEAGNALIVVNLRKTARQIYKLLPDKKYHLSTYMTHEDRSAVIAEVKESLERHERFCLVSTSLIEAGVDLDFDLVFRETAGLDNLLQTAGRCNREGKKQNCRTCTFEFEEKELQPQNDEFTIKKQYCLEALEKYENVASPEAVALYFDRLYSYTLPDMESMDFKRALSAASCGIDGFGFDFARYAADFRLIDDHTQPLAIVTEENRKIVRPLLDAAACGGMAPMRKLQKYTIALRPADFAQLYQAGVVCDANGLYYLDCERYYNRETGICFENNDACYW
ncbi:CRISPR-associated helicase/endonuclease Cas3 [Marasmitruncus massiliensis]|uniref:CRISPR-associated helicase/endonuclease Cas3 n=1 Tax=Marasmitruncus massiliensis TaxID=1944642 RepID=UPI000C7C5B16|nr:CRISPR-associated helicase/endonuclease Cas3 [Marasmitruncus massiliensis]